MGNLQPIRFSNRALPEPAIPLGETELQMPTCGIPRPDDVEDWQLIDPRREFHHEAYEPHDPELMPTVVVARNPAYPHQRIIGPQACIPEIMLAYYFLDRLYPQNTFRQMDLVVGTLRDHNNAMIRQKIKYDFTHRPDGHSFNQALLEHAGIWQNISSSKFALPDPSDPPVGIYPDVDWPAFFLQGWPHDDALFYHAVSYMLMILHDWTHVEQYRNHLSEDTGLMERQAISNANLSLYTLLLHNFIPPDLEPQIVKYLRGAQKITQDFQRGGYGHIPSDSFMKAGDPSNYPAFTDFTFR